MVFSNGTQNQSHPNQSLGAEELLAMYEDTINFERNIGIVIPTIFALVIFVGLIGNILVILVVLLNDQMRNSTNILITNLAISDLLFLTLCVPFTAADYALPVWVFAEWWCGMLNYLQFVSAYASVWTLVFMAFDRYLAVVFPIKSLTLRSIRNTTISLIILWTIICLACIPVYVVYEVFNYTFIMEPRSACGYVGIIRRTAYSYQVLSYYLSFNICGFLIPLGITCVLYCIMIKTLWAMHRPGAPRMDGSRTGRRDDTIRAKRKVTWMVTAVTVSFALCWLPLNICFVITAVNYVMKKQPRKSLIIFQIFGQCLAYANSCLNPILYAFLSDNFRKGFRKIFGFLWIIFSCRRDGSRNFQLGTATTIEYQTSATPLERSSRSRSVEGTRRAKISSPLDYGSTARLLNHRTNAGNQQRSVSAMLEISDVELSQYQSNVSERTSPVPTQTDLRFLKQTRRPEN